MQNSAVLSEHRLNCWSQGLSNDSSENNIRSHDFKRISFKKVFKNRPVIILCSFNNRLVQMNFSIPKHVVPLPRLKCAVRGSLSDSAV